MRSSLRAVAAPFLISRTAVLLLIVAFSSMQDVRSSFGIVRETRIDLRSFSARAFVTGDAEWFRSIAQDGYAREKFRTGEQRNWAFFPAFPLAVRYLPVLPDYAARAVLLTNVFFLGALMMLFALTKIAGFDDEAARLAVMYAAFFPTSYFFSLPVSESLFMLVTAGCFVAAFSDRWLLAGVLGALASATRVQGVLVIVFLAVLWWQRRRPWRGLVAMAIAPLGLVAFCLFLRHLTGDAFAFIDIQRDWQREGGPLQAIGAFFRDLPVISSEWNFRVLNLLALLALIAAAVVLWRRGQAAMAAFVAVSVALPVLSGSLQSMSRYVLSAFPAFIGFAAVRWNPRTHYGIQCALAMLLGALCVLFAMHIDIAMA